MARREIKREIECDKWDVVRRWEMMGREGMRGGKRVEICINEEEISGKK